MKKLYATFLLALSFYFSNAQSVVSVSPAVIGQGTDTLIITCENANLLSLSATQVSLYQPDNSQSWIYAFSETVLDDNHLRAIISVGTFTHGGFYQVRITATGAIINWLDDAVFITGLEESKLLTFNPYIITAGSTLTAQVTGKNAHFMTSTGFNKIQSVAIYNNDVTPNGYISVTNPVPVDSNLTSIDINVPVDAVNGLYNIQFDIWPYGSWDRLQHERFLRVQGGVEKRIVSISPNTAVAGDSVYAIIHVTGMNALAFPVTTFQLAGERNSYNYSVYAPNIIPIDSTHFLVRMKIQEWVPCGDYKIYISNAQGSIRKRYAFRVVPPNITGQVYFDADSNGVKNGTEHGVPGRKVLLLPDSIVAFTNSSGYYHYNVDSGNYTVQYVPDTLWTLTSVPSAYSILIDDSALTGFDFGIYHDSLYEHLFSFWHNNVVRCNQTGFSYWQVVNTEEVIHHGLIRHIHSPNLIVTSTQIPPDSVHGDTLYWNYTVLPGQTVRCDIQYLNPSMGDTVWYVYTDLVYNAQGIPAVVYADSYETIVRCSYDPNDKQVEPAEDSLHPFTDPAADLIYQIRFQNTGTDTAFLVTLRDTLDPSLDLNTFEVLSSRHEVNANLDFPSRIVTFTFYNIQLPDSNIDEPGSHGFVRYKIKALPGVPDSTLVTNTAYIYFDFNPYVQTNTTQSHLVYASQPAAGFSASDTSFCENACISFANASTNATAYHWIFEGAIPSTSTDVNPQNICYADSGTWDVTLIATNPFSSDTLYLPDYIIVTQVLAALQVTMSSDTLYCFTNPDYVSYQWYLDGNLIPGATDTFLVVTAPGNYSIVASGNGGCFEQTDTLLSIPAASFTVTDMQICPNHCVSFTSTSSQATSWLWTFSGAVTTSSADENPIGICYHNAGAFDVSLVVSNMFGSDTLTMPAYITVNPEPAIPVITNQNDTLYTTTSPDYISYQWYYNSLPIPGATDTFVVATQNGLYQVIVENSFGCSVSGDMQVILLTHEWNAEELLLRPNPATSELILDGRWMEAKDAAITLYSLEGLKMNEFIRIDKANGELRLDIVDLPAGLYFITIYDSNKVWAGKFVKQK